MTRAAPVLGLLALAAGLALGFLALWDSTVPADLRLPAVAAEDEFAAAALEEGRSYDRFLIVTFVLGTLTSLAVLLAFARRGPALVRKSAAGPVGTGAFLAMVGTGLVWLSQLPFGVAEVWWARRHDVIEIGYAEVILGGWAGLGGGFAAVTITVLIAMGLGRRLRRTWWIPTAVAFAAVILVLAFVAPWLLAGSEPVRSERLQAAAERIAEREHVADVPLRVEEISDVTPAPNAYAVGIGPSRRVVLWDTITDFPRRQVEFAVAHEYAHHSRDHILKGVALFLLLALPIGLVVSLALRRRGGFTRPEVVPLVMLVVALAQLAALPLQSSVSRQYEREADWRALNLTREPAAAEALMRNFNRRALTDPDPPGWYAWLAEDHPSLVDRIAMARAWAQRETGEQNP